MVDLSTSWLGLELPTPFVVGASPLSREPEAIAAAVDAGASAVVLFSLFEEQLVHEQMGAHRFLDARVDVGAEASTMRPASSLFPLDVGLYARAIDRLRKRVAVPIVASLNGTTPGGWTTFARQLEDAGASALELNLYEVATSPEEGGAAVEARQLEVVRAVVDAVLLPVNVKITPFYASVPSFVRRLEAAGARGVAVFNRFYQPDVDLDALDVDRRLVPSSPSELPLRLHALAVLSPWTRLSLACTGGVHGGHDAAKAILCGAHVVQLASVLLTRGPRAVGPMLDELRAWLEAKEYASAAEARGVLNLASAPDPHAYERVNYVRVLEGWRSRDERVTVPPA